MDDAFAEFKNKYYLNENVHVDWDNQTYVYRDGVNDFVRDSDNSLPLFDKLLATVVSSAKYFQRRNGRRSKMELRLPKSLASTWCKFWMRMAGESKEWSALSTVHC